MKRWRIAVVLTGLAAVLTCPASLAAQADLDEQIDAAIERGAKSIWSTQRDTGRFSDLDPANVPKGVNYPGDRTVMAMVALAWRQHRTECRPESRHRA